ncbi:MAG: tRNA pseudouridine(38-40) synthase TruA [Hadesarchaea archaeon]|nr:tRNA pseudouridine(38-40) synthase TruA [Hadesarchaea archaeon]
MRYAFLVAYDGSRYFGFVRQPGRPTIEAELLKAFKKCGVYRELKEARFRTAARTDRGVSALGQVVALDVIEEPNLPLINVCLPDDIAALAVAEVGPEFDPRRQAQSKHYRYICEAPPGFDLSLARRAARLLEGPHDFKQFCKHERGRSTIGELEHASVSGQKILSFDFIARAFLWQQVRRMVGALLGVGTGKFSLGEFKQMLEGQAKQAMRPAPPEGLILVGIRYLLVALRPDARAVSKFIKHLRGREHPSYEAMTHLLRAVVPSNS